MKNISKGFRKAFVLVLLISALFAMCSIAVNAAPNITFTPKNASASTNVMAQMNNDSSSGTSYTITIDSIGSNIVQVYKNSTRVYSSTTGTSRYTDKVTIPANTSGRDVWRAVAKDGTERTLSISYIYTKYGDADIKWTCTGAYLASVTDENSKKTVELLTDKGELYAVDPTWAATPNASGQYVVSGRTLTAIEQVLGKYSTELGLASGHTITAKWIMVVGGYFNNDKSAEYSLGEDIPNADTWIVGYESCVPPAYANAPVLVNNGFRSYEELFELIPYSDATKSSIRNNTIRPGTYGVTTTVTPVYTVTYDPNGGTGTIASQSFDKGSSVKIKSSDGTGSDTGFIRPGYRFVRWSTNAAGTGTTYNPNDTYNKNADLKLYAIWSSNEVWYEIEYDLKGGTLATEPWDPSISTIFDSTSTVTPKTKPLKTSYFNSNQFINPTKDLAQGTDAKAKITAACGTYDSWFFIEAPTKPGYTFDGWDITGLQSTTANYLNQSTGFVTTVSGTTLSRKPIFSSSVE